MTVILICCYLFFLLDSTDENEDSSSLKSCSSQTISSAAQQPSYSCSNIITSCGVSIGGHTSISPSAQSDLHEVIDLSTMQPVPKTKQWHKRITELTDPFFTSHSRYGIRILFCWTIFTDKMWPYPPLPSLLLSNCSRQIKHNVAKKRCVYLKILHWLNNWNRTRSKSWNRFYFWESTLTYVLQKFVGTNFLSDLGLFDNLRT